MSTELLQLARELFVWMLVLSLQLACILLLRKPLARYCGASMAYRLWLLPLLWLPLHWVDWSAIEWSLPEFSWSANGNPQGSVSWFPLMAQGVDVVLDLPELAFSLETGPRSLWLATAALWFGIAALLLAAVALKTRSFARQLPRLAPDYSPGDSVLPASPFPPTLPVRCIAGLQSPALYGVLRPQLLLPSDFTQRFAPGQRALILAHEAVHYRRRDNFWNLVACCLRLLFWFNPLLHLAWHRFRLDQEMSCDEQALQHVEEVEGMQYARTLIESAVWTTEAGGIRNTDALPTLTSWGRLSEIKERARMIHFHIRNKPHTTAGRFVVPVLALTLFFLTGSLTGQLQETVAAEPQETLSRPVYEVIERVMQLRDSGELSEAKHLLDELEARAGSEANSGLNNRERQVVWQFQADTARMNGDLETARDYLEKLYALPNPSPRVLPQALDQLGALNFMQEDYQSAINYFLQLLELDLEPGTKRATHLRTAFAYNALQEQEQAIYHLESARSLGENSASTLRMLQTLYQETGQGEKAAEVVAAINELESRLNQPEGMVNALEEYRATYSVPPQYPNRALRDRIEGWAVVSFTVDESGNVVDPLVVEASPEGIFDEPSLAAISQFKFNPHIVDGEPARITNIRHVFRYNLSNQ